MEGLLETADARGLPAPVEPVLRRGHPASILLDVARGADLLVVGTRGHGGFTGLLLGSISHQVASRSPCPVVIVPPVEVET